MTDLFMDEQTRRFRHWCVWLPGYRWRRVQDMIARLHSKGVL